MILLLGAFVAGCASNADEGSIANVVSTIPDTTAPTVTITSPTDTAVAVPVNRKVSVAFSENMDAATLVTSFTLTGPGTAPVAGTVTTVGSSATFIPGSNLANNTIYTATITTGAKDLAGNALVSDFVFSFTTGTTADVLAPTVTVTSPANTAPAVPVNRIVTVGFSEMMDPVTITSASFTLTGPGTTPVTGIVVPVGTSVTFTPSALLTLNTLYTATIKGGISGGVKDLAGNAMVNNYVFTFTTGPTTDATAPTIIMTGAENGATGLPVNRNATATFSEPMDPATLASPATSFTLTLFGSAVPIPGVVSYTGNTATFNPNSDLLPSTRYTTTVTTAAKDLAGNALIAGLKANPWSWTTGAAADTTRPTVILVVPADTATNVATSSAVHATFSEEMDPLTISTATFTLADGVTPVTGVVTYDAPSKIATFTPGTVLATATTYTATITTGATDLAANALLIDYVWSFTTANAVVPPPSSHLGSAGAFGIMATSAITNTGASTRINGDVSLDPGTSNGLLPIQVNGTIHINDAVSALARIDLLTAYNYYTNLPIGVTVPGGMDLGAFSNGGLPGVLPPGTYTSGSTMLVSTPLTLDGNGDANAIWVFQIGSSLTTTNSVSLINGAQAKNVFWVPVASATVGVGTIFNGNIIAGVSATGQTSAVINGRILAGATNPGTIALDTNTVNVPSP